MRRQVAYFCAAQWPGFAPPLTLLGSVVLEQVGAGILGFTMTFALTNVWSHGTWVTAAHAHLALFGTFGMLGLAAAYYAVPVMRGAANFDQRLGKLAFWLVFTGILGLGFAFAIGGTVQVYVYRTLGLDWFGGDVAPAMLIAKAMVPLFGIIFTAGVALLAYDLLTLGLRENTAASAESPYPAAAGWGRPLSGWETGIWLLAMWVFGGVITLGLLSFNLDTVQQGSALVPYIMGGTGYPGLLLATLFFVWRFLHSLEARGHARLTPLAGVPAPAGTA